MFVKCFWFSALMFSFPLHLPNFLLLVCEHQSGYISYFSLFCSAIWLFPLPCHFTFGMPMWFYWIKGPGYRYWQAVGVEQRTTLTQNCKRRFGVSLLFKVIVLYHLTDRSTQCCSAETMCSSAWTGDFVNKFSFRGEKLWSFHFVRRQISAWISAPLLCPQSSKGSLVLALPRMKARVQLELGISGCSASCCKQGLTCTFRIWVSFDPAQGLLESHQRMVLALELGCSISFVLDSKWGYTFSFNVLQCQLYLAFSQKCNWQVLCSIVSLHIHWEIQKGNQ